MLVTTLLIVVLFPVFQDSFGKSLQDVPDSLKSILGEAADYQRIEGFLELQVFMQMIFLTIIYGIILCTGQIAGEENDGTLQTLLSHPVSRTKVYVQKLLASTIILLIVSLAMFLGIVIGAALIGEPVSAWSVFQGSIMQWLVALAYSMVGYMLGAVTGRRGLSGALAGSFAFVSYMISSLVNTVEALKIVNYASPFRYFNNPRVMEHGIALNNVLILVVACTAMAYLGWFMFKKRA